MQNSITRLMVRITKAGLVLISALFIISCSGNSSNKGSRKDSAENDKSGKEATKNELDLSVVATDACDCISDFESALSDEAKELVIEASKNGGMDTITRAFSDKDKEIWSSEGSKARNCVKQLEKKYPGLRKASSADYKKALEEHCSEFAAAVRAD